MEVLDPTPKKPNKKSLPLKSAKSAHEDRMDIDPPLQKPSTTKAGEKVVLPAVHSDNDSTVTDPPPKKPSKWTMPILSDDEGNPKPKAQSTTRVDQIKERNKEKAKEKAKAKAREKAKADGSHGTDKDRDQPNSKRYIPIIVASHFQCLLLTKQLSIIFFSVTPLLMARTSPLASMIGQQASQIMQDRPPQASPAFSKITSVPAPVVAPLFRP